MRTSRRAMNTNFRDVAEFVYSDIPRDLSVRQAVGQREKEEAC